MKRTGAFVVAALLVLSLAGCGSTPEKAASLDSVKTYRDIPGVTEEDIAAIEAVKAGRDSLSYGSLYSTELFLLSDGFYAGFAIAYCALMSELFGIPFVPRQYEWDELMSDLESRALDFTGELTPTAERMRLFGMTRPLAERMLRIFTLKG